MTRTMYRLAAVWLVLLCACVSGDESARSTPLAQGFAEGPLPLRVMTFNIEWGGTHVSFDKVVEAIRLASPDVVGIQEAEGNLERLADALGWYFHRRTAVISRFPLLEAPGSHSLVVFVEMRPGEVVAIANLHLPSDPYGPDWIRDGSSEEDVVALERRARLPFLEPYLKVLPRWFETGMPAFVTGDFNTPAHTDWTAEMVGARPFLDRPVAWPVSIAMEAAGFRDAWRRVHPDVARHPGLTWWAARPPLPEYAPGDNDAQDRIDMIWFAGSATARHAIIVGEASASEVSIAVDPWPSDHRAVVVSFEVTPAPMPDLIAVEHHVYRVGDTVRIRLHRTTDETSCGPATILPADGSSPTRTTPACDMLQSLEARSPGRYRVTFDGDSIVPPVEYEVLARNARPTLTVTRESIDGAIRTIAQWQNAPGNRNDYIAIYDEATVDDPEAMLAWVYIDAQPSGSKDISELLGGDGPFRVRLLKDDGYEVLAEALTATTAN